MSGILTILVIREDGSRSSWRMRRLWWNLAVASLILLPCAVGGMGWLCWELWTRGQAAEAENGRILARNEILERKAEQLDTLSVLLKEEKVPGRDMVIRALAGRTPGTGSRAASDESRTAAPSAAAVADARKPGKAAAPAAEEPKKEDARREAPKPAEAASPDAPDDEGALGRKMAQSDGPGHAEFPILDTGYVSVQNVNARVVDRASLRVMLDLRNTGKGTAIGVIVPWLVSADGRRRLLSPAPQEAAGFRIMRFKHAVFAAPLPEGGSAPGDQLILEVRRAADKEIVFRNLFAIER